MGRRRSSSATEAEAKADHLATMNEVAKLIVDPVQLWTLEVLSHFSFEVNHQRAMDEIWPNREKMWSNLVQAGSLAIELSEVLRLDFALRAFLTTSSKFDSKDSLQALATMLSQFGGRVAEARKSPLLVGENGIPEPGPGKPFLPGTLPAKFHHFG
jgi:hypothetical protein